MKTIEIYGQENCGYCARAIGFCRRNRLSYAYYGIADPGYRAEMFSRNPAAETVPQIFIGDQLVGGFDELSAMPLATLNQLMGE